MLTCVILTTLHIRIKRYYRRNSDWYNTGDGAGRDFKCSAEKTCVELKEESDEPDHWHFNYGTYQATLGTPPAF